MDLTLVIAIFLAVALIMLLRAVVHIVPQYQRLVVLTFVEIPQQTCITKDNAPISIDFLIYQRVDQAADSVLKVQNFRTAVTGIATTTLRAVIGDIPLDDVLAKREQINEVLRVKLDEVTQRWGVKVTTVEIREITPPRDIQEAMNRQMAAERGRRAAILDAEGKKQAAILVAEGDKQSNILQAEGARQAAILRAEGFGLALDQINNAANHAEERTARRRRHAKRDLVSTDAWPQSPKPSLRARPRPFGTGTPRARDPRWLGLGGAPNSPRWARGRPQAP